MTRITFNSFDGKLQARVGSGDHCAMVLIEDRDYRAIAGIVLTDDEAEAMGNALLQMARQSREAVPA